MKRNASKKKMQDTCEKRKSNRLRKTKHNLKKKKERIKKTESEKNEDEGSSTRNKKI